MGSTASDYGQLLALRLALDKLRKELHQALDDAHGRIQDPKVQKVAEQFDALMEEYVRLMGY